LVDDSTAHSAYQTLAPLTPSSLSRYRCRCGHCKKLAPVLEEVAQAVRGKMSVGTIDCTQEKKVCQEHNVRGYPTLKFSLDGQVHDYPGGRAAADFISFAERLSRFAIEEIASVDELNAALAKTDDGVAFAVYHPGVRGDTLNAKLQSTLVTQVFTQVARKEIAYGIFYLITDPTIAAAAFGGSGSAAAGAGPEGEPKVCRIEPGVATRCYDRLDTLAMDDLHKFVQVNNVPTVARLGPNNFHKVGRRGKPLLIAVIDLDRPEQIQTAKRELVAYALDGPEDVRSKYYYAYMDGKSFQRFLVQFDVFVDDLPQLLALDVPTRTYHQNATYRLSVDDFVSAVQDGSIRSKNAGKKGLEGALMKIYYAIVEYRPWSVMFLVLVLFAVATVILSLLFPPQKKDPLRPPYKPEEIPDDPVPTKNSPAAVAAPAENKKEK
jgi:thiol-disulfide isomerase/thioredoxin